MSNIVNDLVEDYIRVTLKEKEGFLKDLEIYAEENSVPIIHKEVSDLLKVLLKVQKPKRILEVGCNWLFFYFFCNYYRKRCRYNNC